MREDVEFEGFGGVTLRGWLYQPAAVESELAPAIVMAHGFSATRHMGLAGFAEVFSAAGFAVLVYDHRGLGDSDGEPRQEINPWAQARDYRYALAWLAKQPGIDPDRLAVWGSSFSGGEVLVVGAVDPLVKAVIANVPFAGFSATLDATDLDERFAAMRAALDDESGAGPADSTEPPIGPLPVIRVTGGDPEGPAFLPQPESTAWFEAVGGEGAAWQNTFTLRGLGGADPFDPSVAVPFIPPRPLLKVVATEDRVAAADVARAAFEVAGEPKQLELIAGDHFVPYTGPAFEHASIVMRDFLLSHL
ncbi:MAG: peptidase [Mycobacterium sp.]|nr:peptidase [Mycobacterium sp.]